MHVLLVANRSSERFEFAILPDILFGQRFRQKTDFAGFSLLRVFNVDSCATSWRVDLCAVGSL